jgi:hypothetical protein
MHKESSQNDDLGKGPPYIGCNEGKPYGPMTFHLHRDTTGVPVTAKAPL